jgi:hypothetical protein
MTRSVSTVALLALALLAAPLDAEAQQPGRVPRVGVLGNVRSHHGDVFERALKDLGYEDGKNISALSVPTIRETALLDRGAALRRGASAPRSRRVLPPAR